MNFQEYCRGVDSIDGSASQEIEVNDSGDIIRFIQLKSKKEFLIASKDILAFLNYIKSHDGEVEKIIRSDERFDKGEFTQYEEKGYRSLFTHIKDIQGLSPVSSLAGSQSLGVTQAISKVICFTSGNEYEGVKKNTYFDRNSVEVALNNIGSDIESFLSAEQKFVLGNNLMEEFIKWLEEHSKGLSKSTIIKYSRGSINKANDILSTILPGALAIYTVNDPKIIVQYISSLKGSDDWNESNTKGNSMFSRGINLYKEFLEYRGKAFLNGLRMVNVPKPFILLAGISGTGKTRFVREQAAAHNVGNNNFCLVPVRPDWHEPSDLLGYVSRLSGKPEYVSTKTLNFIIKAWKAIAPHANEKGHGELDFTIPPYWLCLDEMNLAPVEQYFADYLSVLESRKFEGVTYTSEALLDKSQLLDLKQQGADVQKDLRLTDDDELWQYFLNHGVSIPPNLIVAGTVNMDETTHGFSRKVIDRALTIDFGEFYPNDFEGFFDSPVKPKIFKYSLLIQATKDDLSGTYDTDGKKTIKFLKKVNNVLKRTPFELAYRALNELLLHVACFNPKSKKDLQAVWDDFLMSKVLPRIDGDEDKLRLNTNDNETNVLLALTGLLEDQLSEIWNSERHDFYRENSDGSDINVIPCRTKDKLDWMKDRLETNTFTSFWP